MSDNYIYSDNDDYFEIIDNDLSSEINTSEENEVLNQHKFDFEEESSDVLWNDSEEGENELREEYKTINNIVWEENKKPEIKHITTKKYKIVYSKKVLAIENNIKLAKCKKTIESFITVLITTKNDICIYYGEFEDKTPDKIVNLRLSISDFIFLDNENILLCSDKCGILKVLNTNTLEFNDVKKGSSERFHKLYKDDRIFIQSENLLIFNPVNFSLIYQFNEKICDFCVTDDYIILLTIQKNIHFYSKENFALIKVVKIEERFFIQRIFSLSNKIFVCLKAHVKIYDRNMKFIKDSLNFPATNIVENNSFYAYCGSELAQLRISTKRNYSLINTFPFSGIKLPVVSAMFFLGDKFYFAHQRFCSKLTFVQI